jgi:hypothetical protein
MIPADQILDALTLIANAGKSVALTWHVLMFVALATLATGWRPTERTATTLAVLPIASAVVAAAVFRNPFNVALLALVTLALVVMAQRGDRSRVTRGPSWMTAFGLATIAYGWVYPHFLVNESPALYLIAAPVGLLPCPSIAVAIGFVLLGGALGSAPYRATLALVGLFYGAFGALRLGVMLDYGLIAAAIQLGATALVDFRGRSAIRS